MSNPTALHLITSDDRSDLERIDPRTVSERYLNPQTAYWIGHTQVWQWDGGDAITVITNHAGEPCSGSVVIRVGDQISTIPCSGLFSAMKCMGLDPKEFKIQ